MVDLMHCLANLLFFDIPLLYYYITEFINNYFFFSKDIYLSFGISISFSPVFECNSFEVLCGDFETLVNFSCILFPIKSPFVSVVF